MWTYILFAKVISGHYAKIIKILMMPVLFLSASENSFVKTNWISMYGQGCAEKQLGDGDFCLLPTHINK